MFQRVVVVLGSLLLFYFGFVNHIEPSEVGIARNETSGEVWLQSAGWHLTPPWVRVNPMDTRPMRVSVPSAGRGYSAKLVRFDPVYYREFLSTEGFRYYWWANRFSFNSGYDEEYRGLRDILRGYAYSPTSYPFVVLLDEYQQQP